MTIVRTVSDLKSLLEGQQDIGFVPTMGGFHEGHLQLMRRCKSESALTVVSLFVNPTQFGPKEDFHAYPRNEEVDAKLASQEGVDVLFIPTVEQLYNTPDTVVRVTGTSEGFEGTLRPHHFDGVATIVLKLFNIVRPRFAYFGLKDLQQCAVVKKMVIDVFLDIDIRTCETVRDNTGLALSTRNQYLSSKDRTTASLLYKSLSEAAEQIVSGSGDVSESISNCEIILTRAGFLVDYLSLVDPSDMRTLTKQTKQARIVSAVRLGRVRLIDNVPLYSL